MSRNIETVMYGDDMTENWYDYARNLFGEDTGLAGVILRECLEADLPPGLPQTVMSPVVSDDQPGGPSPDGAPPDAVILVGKIASPVRAIVVEFMAGRDNDRRRQWPRFAASAWAEHQCPVDVLVVCPDEETARWCAEPITTTLRGYTCHPKAISLSTLKASLPAN
jgi:hypothetical protein